MDYPAMDSRWKHLGMFFFSLFPVIQIVMFWLADLVVEVLRVQVVKYIRL